MSSKADNEGMDKPLTVQQLIAKLETYGFESKGGPLTKCVDWERLKALIAKLPPQEPG